MDNKGMAETTHTLIVGNALVNQSGTSAEAAVAAVNKFNQSSRYSPATHFFPKEKYAQSVTPKTSMNGRKQMECG